MLIKDVERVAQVCNVGSTFAVGSLVMVDGTIVFFEVDLLWVT